jgi:chaperonin GroEL (HSP60 family)
MAVVDIVQTTLGPRGMDKMIYTDDGATVLPAPPQPPSPPRTG